MVREAKRAWHAGASRLARRTDTNSRSIGIEIVNPGHFNGYPDFPDCQINAVIDLCKDILKRNPKIAHNVIAHSDVAPAGKSIRVKSSPGRFYTGNGIGKMANFDALSDKALGDFQTLEEGTQGSGVLKLQEISQAYGYAIALTGEYCAQKKL